MQHMISTRHTEIDETTRQVIDDELNALEQRFPKLTSARVVIELQKPWFFSEIVIFGKNLEVEAKGKATEMLPSAQLAIEKAERQLTKHLDRMQDHQHVPTGEIEAEIEEAALASVEDDE